MNKIKITYKLKYNKKGEAEDLIDDYNDASDYYKEIKTFDSSVELIKCELLGYTEYNDGHGGIERDYAELIEIEKLLGVKE